MLTNLREENKRKLRCIVADVGETHERFVRGNRAVLMDPRDDLGRQDVYCTSYDILGRQFMDWIPWEKLRMPQITEVVYPVARLTAPYPLDEMQALLASIQENLIKPIDDFSVDDFEDLLDE